MYFASATEKTLRRNLSRFDIVESSITSAFHLVEWLKTIDSDYIDQLSLEFSEIR